MKHISTKKVWTLLYFLFQMIQHGDSSATLQLQLVSFRNDANQDSSGSCCDFGCNYCDTTFLFCIDQYYSFYTDFKDLTKCSIFRRKTGTYKNRKNVDFDHDANGIKNPIELSFQSWPGAMILKALVWDVDDYNEDDEVERDIQLVWAHRPAFSASQASYGTHVIQGATGKSLTVRVRAWCDPHWHGSTCSVFCEPRDNAAGHYTCHPDTGAKECMAGWEGENCEIKTDDCEMHSCSNGATCIDGQGEYTCACASGFTGRFCEEDIDECLSSPCAAGGTCVDGRGTFTCLCPPGWVGQLCEGEACQENNPCQNGATCYGHRHCLCPPGYTGNFCETDKCEQQPCANGGTCRAGQCTCRPGFTGLLCDVNQCDIKECHNGGVCVEGHCDCAGTGYNGSACQVKLDFCKSASCGGRGECTSLRLSYKCDCYAGYRGENCEEIVPPTEPSKPSTSSTSSKPSIPNINKIDPSKREKPEIQASSERKEPTNNNQMWPMMWYVIAGVVVAVLLVILLASVLACALNRRRKRRSREEDPYSVPSSDYTGYHSNPAYGSVGDDSMPAGSASSASTGAYVPRHGLASPPSYDESEMAAAALSILPEKEPAKVPLSDDSSDEEEHSEQGAGNVQTPSAAR